MDRNIARTRGWPMWIRVLATAAVLAAACAIQLPLENEVPGEPFLLFLLAVIGATLAFGARVGFVALDLTVARSIAISQKRHRWSLTVAIALRGKNPSLTQSAYGGECTARTGGEVELAVGATASAYPIQGCLTGSSEQVCR